MVPALGGDPGVGSCVNTCGSVSSRDLILTLMKLSLTVWDNILLDTIFVCQYL